LRSIAVIVASLLAGFLPSVTAEEADAAAAVIVSVLIVLSLVPLCAGMKQTFEALKRVNFLLQKEELESGYEYDDEEEEGSFV
jgi:Co/Zn/Cd efflux system component